MGVGAADDGNVEGVALLGAAPIGVPALHEASATVLITTSVVITPLVLQIGLRATTCPPFQAMIILLFRDTYHVYTTHPH